jgi:metal-responsive CopG/Arc/MetJ family transcriptional regulator
MKKIDKSQFNFDLPTLQFSNGKKTMVSIRMPQKLWKKLEANAKSKGWDRSDLVKTILDLYLQQEDFKKT